MDWLNTIGLAIALGCDAFAVGLGVGGRFNGARQVFRLSFHFGFFQFLMPVIGWFLGRELVEFTSVYGPWIAAALLVYIGFNMIKEGIWGGTEEKHKSDPTRGLTLIILSIATSLDALGVGFSMGLVGWDILTPSIVIGIVAATMTFTAMYLGKILSSKFGKIMEVAGGIILLAIAASFVLLK